MNEKKNNLTIEKARVLAVDSDSLWVETFQVSTCGQCAANNACGQGVLGKWFSRGPQCFRISCEKGEADLLTVGQWVDIAIQDSAIIKASMISYLLPLLGLIAGAALAESLKSSELVVLIAAAGGFFGSLFLSHRINVAKRNDSLYQPRLLGIHQHRT